MSNVDRNQKKNSSNDSLSRSPTGGFLVANGRHNAYPTSSMRSSASSSSTREEDPYMVSSWSPAPAYRRRVEANMQSMPKLESMPKSGVLPSLTRAVNANSHVISNVYGREIDDVVADSFDFLTPQKPFRNPTPGLMFDSDSPHPSTPGIPSPISYAHGPSRDGSPPISSGESNSKSVPGSAVQVEMEDGLVSATQAMEIHSNQHRLSLQVPSISIVEADERSPSFVDSPSEQGVESPAQSITNPDESSSYTPVDSPREQSVELEIAAAGTVEETEETSASSVRVHNPSEQAARQPTVEIEELPSYIAEISSNQTTGSKTSKRAPEAEVPSAITEQTIEPLAPSMVMEGPSSSMIVDSPVGKPVERVVSTRIEAEERPSRILASSPHRERSMEPPTKVITDKEPTPLARVDSPVEQNVEQQLPIRLITPAPTMFIHVEFPKGKPRSPLASTSKQQSPTTVTKSNALKKRKSQRSQDDINTSPTPASRHETWSKTMIVGRQKPQKFNKKHMCEYAGCNKLFTRPFDRRRHIENVHEVKNLQCPECGEKLSRLDSLNRHRKSRHDVEIESQKIGPNKPQKLRKKLSKSEQPGPESEVIMDYRRRVDEGYEIGIQASMPIG